MYNFAPSTRTSKRLKTLGPAGDTRVAIQEPLILVVEDDFVLRSALVELLTNEGFEVECAADGLEALMRLDSIPRKPSLILLDLTLPRMDGIRFRQVQKSLPNIANIPVIAVTGSAKALRTGYDRSDFHDTFFKPLDMAKLLNVIRDLSASGDR